jgi:hypothetical protein
MARADVRPQRYTVQVKPQDADPARTPISRGTKSSNPLPSSEESGANPALLRALLRHGTDPRIAGTRWPKRRMAGQSRPRPQPSPLISLPASRR